MTSDITPTANQSLLHGLKQRRIERLLAASAAATGPVAHICAVSHIVFHPSHASAVAVARFPDNVQDVIWVAYQGAVTIVLIEVPAPLLQALQQARSQITLCLDKQMLRVSVVDSEGTEHVYECQPPELS